jgi:hypothetical protein
MPAHLQHHFNLTCSVSFHRFKDYKSRYNKLSEVLKSTSEQLEEKSLACIREGSSLKESDGKHEETSSLVLSEQDILEDQCEQDLFPVFGV